MQGIFKSRKFQEMMNEHYCEPYARSAQKNHEVYLKYLHAGWKVSISEV